MREMAEPSPPRNTPTFLGKQASLGTVCSPDHQDRIRMPEMVRPMSSKRGERTASLVTNHQQSRTHPVWHIRFCDPPSPTIPGPCHPPCRSLPLATLTVGTTAWHHAHSPAGAPQEPSRRPHIQNQECRRAGTVGDEAGADEGSQFPSATSSPEVLWDPVTLCTKGQLSPFLPTSLSLLPAPWTHSSVKCLHSIFVSEAAFYRVTESLENRINCP